MLGSGELNGLANINFGCTYIWEIQYYVQLKRRFHSINVRDTFINLIPIGEHGDFRGLSFVNRINYFNFKNTEKILWSQFL